MLKNNLVIKRVTRLSDKVLEDINLLLSQWYKKSYSIDPEYLTLVIKNNYLIALYDYDHGSIVGIVTLIKIPKLSGVKGSIEHLILDEKYRGQGLGEKLMVYAIDFAKSLGINTLFLTCESEREVANALYQKLGFNIKKTNFYYLNLNNSK